MTADLPPPAGLLVVRVWREGPGPDGFRARVTASADLLGGDEWVTTTADPAVVAQRVRDWLATIAAMTVE